MNGYIGSKAQAVRLDTYTKYQIDSLAEEILIEAKPYANPILLTSTDDLNDLENGWYYWDSPAPANAPETFCIMHQYPARFETGEATAFVQEARKVTTVSIEAVPTYQRAGFPSTVGWGSWMDMRPLGVGQTLVDLISSRAYDVDYTNTTGRAIAVFVSSSINVANGNLNAYLVVDNIQITPTAVTAATGTSYVSGMALVPKGSIYRYARVTAAANLVRWTELR